MDSPNTPAPYEPAGYLPQGHRVVVEILAGMKQECARLEREGQDLSDEMPLAQYTIRDAAEMTGRPRHEIYRLIKRGAVKADLGHEPPAWWIPAAEVEKLMPNKASDSSLEGANDGPE